MQRPSQSLVAIGTLFGVLALALFLVGCDNQSDSDLVPHDSLEERRVALENLRGRLAPNSPLDRKVDFSIRLALSYDPATNAFAGTLTNHTPDPLLKARVRICLDGSADRSTHITLVNLAPSQVREITLLVDSKPFNYWHVVTEMQTPHGTHLDTVPHCN